MTNWWQEGGLGSASVLRARALNPTLTVSSSIYIFFFLNIISRAFSLPTHQLHNSPTPQCPRSKRGLRYSRPPGHIIRRTKRTVRRQDFSYILHCTAIRNLYEISLFEPISLSMFPSLLKSIGRQKEYLGEFLNLMLWLL